jgi:hypothetical protein
VLGDIFLRREVRYFMVDMDVLLEVPRMVSQKGLEEFIGEYGFSILNGPAVMRENLSVVYRISGPEQSIDEFAKRVAQTDYDLWPSVKCCLFGE